MSHRKWRETKQQPSRARSGHKISSCLVSLLFLCDIPSSHAVDQKCSKGKTYLFISRITVTLTNSLSSKASKAVNIFMTLVKVLLHFHRCAVTQLRPVCTYYQFALRKLSITLSFLRQHHANRGCHRQGI